MVTHDRCEIDHYAHAPGQRILDGGRIADRDIPGHGWSAGVSATYDLGVVELGVGASTHAVDGPYGSGRYHEVSASLTRRFHWARGVPGWISLTLGRRIWEGTPPDGELDATTLMLNLGGAF